MTVIVGHDPVLELNRTELLGEVTLAELEEHAAFQARRPEILKQDGINLVRPGAEFIFGQAEIDRLFALYAELYGSLNLGIMRRAAWVCQSPSVTPLIEYWLSKDPRIGFRSLVKLFDSFIAAADWLVLDPSLAVNLETGHGFQEIARFAKR